MMEILLIIAGVVLIGGLIGGFLYLMGQPPLEVRESLIMDVPADKAYACVADFRRWDDWSPWIMHEPNAPVKYDGQAGQAGSSMSWDGKHIGAGTLTHAKLQQDKTIDSRIEFLRPFRSTATISWTFTPQQQGTEVAWTMKSKMPILFRFMTKTMKKSIAADYRMGLLMLNRRLDKKAALFQLEFVGEKERAGFTGIYETYEGLRGHLKHAMHQAFTNLFTSARENKVQLAGAGCVAYWKVNMRKGFTVCDSVLPVAEPPPSDIKVREYQGGRYMLVRFRGSYDNLDLAWMAAMFHMRLKKLKMDKKRASLEVYEKSPMNTKHADDYVTDLYVPLRA